MFIYIHLYCINMPQLFTFIRGCLCSSVKMEYGVDDRRIVFRFLVAAVCCALTHILQIWSRDELPFYSRDTRGSFFWGERLQRATPIIVGYVAGLTWKNRSIWYTWQFKLLVTFIKYTQPTYSAEVCIIDCWRRVLDTHRIHHHGLDFTHAQGNFTSRITYWKFSVSSVWFEERSQ